MNLFDAQVHMPELVGRLADHDGLVIACYCAAWCDTCRAYRGAFEELAARTPQHLFVWIDIEEAEALLDDEEVENFPTLLVQSPRGNLFFGAMLPHPDPLQRLLSSMDERSPVIDSGPGDLRALLGSE